MTNDALSTICLSFKGAVETVKWDHLCFTIGEKVFCLSGLDQGGGVSFKIAEDDFDELIEQEGFIQALHFAKRKWINAQENCGMNLKEWKQKLAASYELVKLGLTKKMQESLK